MLNKKADINLSFTPDELKNGGWEDVASLMRILHKQNVTMKISSDGYCFIIEGYKKYDGGAYVFVEDDEVVVPEQFVNWEDYHKSQE